MNKSAVISLVFILTSVLASGQIHDASVMTSKGDYLVKEFERKMTAVLVEAGDIVVENPDYFVGDVDIVTWLKENKPEVYDNNRDFLNAFAKDYLGIENEGDTTSGLLEWYKKFYKEVTQLSEKIARRLVDAWRRG